jgi:NAD(P)-dependent dehydrogenase (short-subunit alcohol dehydrogenase family)
MISIPSDFAEAKESPLRGQVILVEGGASGIGFSTAKLFAEAGATVAIADKNTEQLGEAVKLIGCGSVGYLCDVSSWDNHLQTFEVITKQLGPPTVVCLNAGIDPELTRTCVATKVEEMQLGDSVLHNYLADELDADANKLKQPPSSILDVNFYGVLYGIKLAHHFMKIGTGGRIIVTGSVASYIGYPLQDVYVASKHAVLGLVRATSRRAELNHIINRISICMIAPGLTDTPLTSSLFVNCQEPRSSSTAVDVGKAIVYLATLEHDLANGRCLWIQGSKMIEIETMYQNWLDLVL